MPRTNIPVTTLPDHGGTGADVSFTAADAANDHSFTNDGRTLLLIKNDDASPKTVTGVAVADPFGRTVNTSWAVGANSVRLVGPFSPELFSQSDGTMHVDITADTSLFFATLRLPRAYR